MKNISYSNVFVLFLFILFIFLTVDNAYAANASSQITSVLKAIQTLIKNVTPFIAFIAISFVVYKVWFNGNTWREAMPFLGGTCLLLVVPYLIELINI